MSPVASVRESRTLQALGVRPERPGTIDPSTYIRTLRRLATEGDGLVGLFDARAIASERHLLSAWAHMGRARARGEQRLRDRGAELALYVAGDDQLPRALAKVGLGADSHELVLVYERPRSGATLLAELGLVRDESVYPRPMQESVLDRLGISEIERRTVPSTAWEGLVLERVALLELTAPRSGGAATAKP